MTQPTAQLKLRAVEQFDLQTLYDWENDTSIWDVGVTCAPYSHAAIQQYIDSSGDGILITRQLRLMVETANGTTIGAVDLYDYDPINSRAGVGILINKPMRGKGLGTAALSKMCDYAFQRLHINQLYATIPADNEASLATFQHCGFVISGRLNSWLKSTPTYKDAIFLQLVK